MAILFGRAEPFRQFCREIIKKNLQSGSGGDAVYISYLHVCGLPSCLKEGNPLGKFGRGYYNEHFCEIVLIWISGLGGDFF